MDWENLQIENEDENIVTNEFENIFEKIKQERQKYQEKMEKIF